MSFRGLFYPTRVIGRGSESNGLVIVDLILIDDNVVAILVSVLVFVPVVWGTLAACQEMIEKARSKVLFEYLYQYLVRAE